MHGECRYLLQRGLQRLRQPQRLGLQALYERAGLNPAGLSEEHIGFVIGPRLNAIGRLGDANPVVDFLTTEDQSQANVFALQLEALNERRKLLGEQIYGGALALLERQPELNEYAALVLAHPEWAPGVIGIVASRLVERFAKPVILLNGPEGGPWRGSARSIATGQYHFRDSRPGRAAGRLWRARHGSRDGDQGWLPGRFSPPPVGCRGG